MMTFEKSVINETVDKLINGEDYREQVVNAINVQFFDFVMVFLKKVMKAKANNENINNDWYKENFISSDDVPIDERVINSGLNKKTVTNIYGSSKKDVMENAALNNYDYLSGLIDKIGNEDEQNIEIKSDYNDSSINLDLKESLLVINALANKKLAIRGGAWSSIGKKVEKPLIDRLCAMAKVPKENIDNKTFVKNKELDYDREVDYKLITKDGDVKRIEVKLMGKGNPESADAIIARDSNIFVADTLSDQNKRQCEALGVKWLELKNNENIIDNFKKILNDLNIPYND